MAVGKKEAFSVQALQLLDGFLVWVAFWLGSTLRNPVREYILGHREQPESLSTLMPMLFIVIPAVPITLEIFGFYRHPLRKKISSSLVQMAQALVCVGAIVALMVIFLRVPVESRWVMGSAVPLAMLMILAREGIVKTMLKRSVRAEDVKEAVIYVGAGKTLASFEEQLPDDVKETYKVVAQFDPVKGTVDELRELLKAESVARVIFATKHTEFGKLTSLVEECELQGVEAWIWADFIQTQVARPAFDVLGNEPMLVLRSTPELSWALWVKEVMDRVLAFLAIALTSWLWIIAAVGIKLSSPGPVFFRQKRAGRYGRPFRMWKFRTMVVDAEAQLKDVKASQGNEMSGPVFKLEDDPRVFKFGRFIRKYSIDELPQFLNVLLGDMSLVGPRPLPLYEVEDFEKSAHRRRLSVKPGITCDWQVGGRNQITEFEDWVQMDLDYIDNWSLSRDLKLLLKTVPAVLFGKGAK